MRKYRVVELYAGIARTWEAFRAWRRCELGLLTDVNQLAVDNYTDNFPKAPYWRRSLAAVSPSELEAKAGGKIDILLGCPPCQGFSDTGKRDPDDPRNIHVSIFGHFVCALNPLAVVLENVPLLGASNQYRRFTRTLERAGYRWTDAIINAAHYGSCQTRQRLLLVALHKRTKAWPTLSRPTHGGERLYFGYQRQEMLRLSDSPAELFGITPATFQLQARFATQNKPGRKSIPTVGEVLSGLPPIGSAEALILTHEPWQTSGKMVRRMARVPEGGRWYGGEDHFSHAYGRLHRRGLARTITTYFANPGSGRFWHPRSERPLTIREAARIQGIEDDFLFHGPLTGIARLVGNALDSAIGSVGSLAVQEALD